MKKILSLILILCIVLTPVSVVHAEEAPTELSPIVQNLIETSSNGDINLLVSRKNYGYIQFVENFRSSAVSLGLMQAAGTLCETGYEPDESKYIEVLSNIIQTYDFSNAADISSQAQLDDLKGFKDYAMDGKNAATDIIGLMSSNSQLEELLTIAIDGLSASADSIDTWLECIYDLDTLVQDYSDYDLFLETIEDNSDGELKSAAKKMRTALSSIFQTKMEYYADATSESLDSFGEFFFSDLSIDLLKNSEAYKNDEAVKLLTDTAGEWIDNYFVLKDSLDLGFIIGKTIGNVVVGGENLINRVLEMEALADISNILGSEITNMATDAISSFSDQKVRETVHLAQMLISARIRGEYCEYSIVASDAGLLSWANKESAEECKNWYERQSNALIELEQRFKNVLTDSIESQLENFAQQITYNYGKDFNFYMTKKSSEYSELITDCSELPNGPLDSVYTRYVVK